MGAAGSWQNPIVLPQPIIIDNPATVTPGNNNNNNIYLTNNIYYKTIDTVDGAPHPPPPDFKQIDGGGGEKGGIGGSQSKELITASGPHHPPPLGHPLHLLTQGGPVGPHILPMPMAFPFSHHLMEGPMNYFNGVDGVDGLLNVSMAKCDPTMSGFPVDTVMSSPTKAMKITDIREDTNVG